MEWISTKDKLPEYETEVDVKYACESGEEIFEGGHAYFENRTCIMAGIAGGYGYFKEGFGTYGPNVDQGLIVDEPTHWRYTNP
jgi:hypothetical protein